MTFFSQTPTTSSERTHSIWNEKYRPSDLDSYIGNDALKDHISRCIAENDIPHFLFFGKAGVGKTTLAKLLVANIQCDYLYINASDENSVDTVRTKIRDFASSMSFHPLKLIILDECLDENTLVWVFRDGKEQSVPIKDVDQSNDLVKSWNVKKSRIEWTPFIKWDRGVQDVYEIELMNGEVVVCTSTHKWYVKSDEGEILVVSTSELDMYDHILSPV